MTSPTRVLKSVGPKLVPFFKTLAIYFVIFISTDNPSVWAMVVKCAPVLSLMFFVLLHGMSLGDEYMFSRRILIGLIFSCLGDALLVWPEYFLHGMCAFGIGQVWYIRAFGFHDLKLNVGIPMYILSFSIVALFSDKTKGILAIGVPAYTFLLVTMAWRAIARVRFSRNLWTWTEICSCLGGISFVISDGFIGYDRFYSHLPHAQVLIMSTYYLAQLGIALSVVDSSSAYLTQQKLKKEMESELANRDASKSQQKLSSSVESVKSR